MRMLYKITTTLTVEIMHSIKNQSNQLRKTFLITRIVSSICYGLTKVLKLSVVSYKRSANCFHLGDGLLNDYD